MKKKFLLMALAAMYCLSLQAARPADGDDEPAKRACVERAKEPNPLDVLATAAADSDVFDHGGGAVLQCHTCKSMLFSPDQGATEKKLIENVQKAHFKLNLCNGPIEIIDARVLTQNEQAIGITQGLDSLYEKKTKIWYLKKSTRLAILNQEKVTGINHIYKNIVYYSIGNDILYVTEMGDQPYDICLSRIQSSRTYDTRIAKKNQNYMCPKCNRFFRKKSDKITHTTICE